MTCDELLKALNDYVDSDIAPAICRELEQHLAGCDPCQIVVDNIRKTIALYKAGEPFELPEPFRAQLGAAIRQRWKEKFNPPPQT
jgi:RNA polymerase sigma-70 factor (ECF subfamily)